jgi:hypothetical protein
VVEGLQRQAGRIRSGAVLLLLGLLAPLLGASPLAAQPGLWAASSAHEGKALAETSAVTEADAQFSADPVSDDPPAPAKAAPSPAGPEDGSSPIARSFLRRLASAQLAFWARGPPIT